MGRMLRNPFTPAVKYAPPYHRVVIDGHIVLLATDEYIIFENPDHSHPAHRFTAHHPAQDQRCRRVYSRLEPHGA
jgi:hypothetical protein